MKRIWLVSGLVSKVKSTTQITYGHRARICVCESEEEAIGRFTKYEIEAGYTIESIAVSDATEDMKIYLNELTNNEKEEFDGNPRSFI